jgi:hypothetical protein
VSGHIASIDTVSGSEIIALVSIVSGAAVAILAPLVSARREDRRAERLVNEARLNELRAVLEDAAVTMSLAINACDAVYEAVQPPYGPPRTATEAELRVLIGQASEQLKAVRLVEDRVALRLGHWHEISDAYREARVALVDAEDRFQQALVGERPKYESREYEPDSAREHFMTFTMLTASLVGPEVPEKVDTTKHEYRRGS